MELSYLGVIFGTIIGLFAGTLIHAISLRLPARLDPLGAVICDSCHEPLPGTAWIPLFTVSCSACQSRTSWHKPATELTAALLVFLALLIHGVTLTGISVAIFALVLLQVLRIDWQHHLIFTIVIVPGSLLAFLFAVLESGFALISSLLAAIVAALIFGFFYVLALLIYRRRALGRGDILLAFLIGAMARFELLVPALIAGMLLAAAGGLFLIAIGKRTRHDFIPYGAYLCAGAIFVLMLPR